MEREIDAGRHPGARPNRAIVHEHAIADDLAVRFYFGELIEMLVVGRRRFVLE
jgi:hypothetical protein